jgi:surface polysaccharide O-acyltransferase-like enzyme
VHLDEKGTMLNQASRLSVPVDVIRTVAIIGVILLHASNDLTVQQMNQFEIIRWCTVDVYQSVGRLGVPLFLLLSGALLLQPSKVDEPLRVFFKKRWARIGLPFIFWGAAFFAWDFLVEHQAFTSSAIIQGVLTGPYYHFWYLYLLVGLYLLTPILRVVMIRASANLIKYLLIVWLVGASLLPVASLLTTYHLESNVFEFTGYAGYFILGAYLLTVRLRRSTLLIFMSLGIALTAIGTYAIAATIGGTTMYFFQDYLSPTLILAAVMLFLLLNTIQVPSSQTMVNEKETKPAKSSHPKLGKLLSVISQNTLPIFLFHVMILESLQNGYFGFAINGNTINSIIGVPLMTVITLFISLVIIVPLKKVPILRKLIG